MDSPGIDPSFGRRRLLGAGAALATGSLWSLPLAAQTGKRRVALVIGNGGYQIGPLANPVNDARAMADLLGSLGFEVVALRDASQAQMREAVAATADRLRGGGATGLFYFAGHGVQLEFRNYLMPVDARPHDGLSLRAQALDVQAVIDAYRQAATAMNIVVLDACRDNPFGRSAGTTGLAPVDAPPGTFLAYATAPGFVAEDGAVGTNGLYTGYLLKEMGQRGARIEDVFKRVRLQVRRASNGRQVPWESTSLEDDFIFASGEKVQAETARRLDEAFDAEKAAWNAVKTSTKPEDLYEFLQRWPNGRMAELAQFKLDQLARPQVVAVAPSGLAPLPSGTDRYRVGDAWTMERWDRFAPTRRFDFAVTSVVGDRVFINKDQLIYDQMGGVIRSRTGDKDPAVLQVPADLQVGKRWRSAFVNDNPGGNVTRNLFEQRVVALETLSLPSGDLKVFHVVARGESRLLNGAPGRLLAFDSWIDPSTMWVVKHHIRQSNPMSGEVIEEIRETMVSMRRVPRA
jgi:hypothetical protein